MSDKTKMFDKVHKVTLQDISSCAPYHEDGIRLSVYFTSGSYDSHHIEFPKNADRAQIMCLLRELSERIHNACEQ